MVVKAFVIIKMDKQTGRSNMGRVRKQNASLLNSHSEEISGEINLNTCGI